MTEGVEHSLAKVPLLAEIARRVAHFARGHTLGPSGSPAPAAFKAVESMGRAAMAKAWMWQTAVLACSAVVIFWGFYVLDHFAEPQRVAGPIEHYLAFDPLIVGNSITSLAGVNTAVFGIVVTVVSIIVQLTAQRYTGVARMFLRDRVNVLVPAYYVVACVVSVWLSAAIHSDFVPIATVTAALSLTTGGLVIMAPYFGYVFWFLEPRNIIVRVRKDAVAHAWGGALEADASKCFAAQAKTLSELEELTDIANNSIAGSDKIIASGAVDALKDLVLAYLEVKPRANEIWFSIGPEIGLSPDFVAMDEESLADLAERRTWLEWAAMRQYLSIFHEALGSMHDINYLIAIDTRYIGEAAARAHDTTLVELVFRFMNSYIRSTLNARDVRAAYNVLNQHRKFIETMLREGSHQAALDGVKHMKYYGLLSFDMELNFVTETVAYDMSALAQLANELGSPAEGGILDEFLDLDRAPVVRSRDQALLGVRKAQVKLAAYYIVSGQELRARAIADDMRNESEARLLQIKRQLGAVESKDFWEIIDRGRNFEHMPPQQRACLETFFEWLKA
jgi:hypothetical protein